jgi:hypothetical protein
MRARFQDQKVCVIIERVYLVIQLASVAGSSIIQFGDIGVYYRKIRQQFDKFLKKFLISCFIDQSDCSKIKYKI